MQRHFMRALLQRTDGMYLASCQTNLFRQGSCLKKLLYPLNRGHLVLNPQKQWLHSSAPPSDTPGKKTLGERQFHSNDPLQKKPSSGSTRETGVELNGEETDPLQDRSLTLLERFKRTFKQYGKVLIPVHLVTSSIWFGSFYYAAMKGVNVVPFLEYIGLPESIVGILKNSQSGNALTAYALYKISTPARYTVTLGGTSISVKYLRKYGYMSTPPPVTVKGYIHNRMEETRELFTEKIEETRDIISGKMEETKDRITEKIQETKDSFMKKKEE
ncbi:protein FAM210A [Ambystoma mexicanum]|uniref:protein FAM210A n=1 Tax=Ambystoma mexicanum TaxID=8296 RepID=UPI0037E73412